MTTPQTPPFDTTQNDARLRENVAAIYAVIDALAVSPERREALSLSVLRGDLIVEVHTDAERMFVTNVAYNRGIPPRRLGTVCSDDYTAAMRFNALRAMGSE